MTGCDYCGRQATTQIPTVPGRVCEVHAQEFWTGLLAYVREQRAQPDESHEPIRASDDESLPPLRLVAAKAGIPLARLRRVS